MDFVLKVLESPGRNVRKGGSPYGLCCRDILANEERGAWQVSTGLGRGQDGTVSWTVSPEPVSQTLFGEMLFAECKKGKDLR